MKQVRKITTYTNAVVIKTNNKRVIVESKDNNFVILIKNHGKKWSDGKGSVGYKYLGRNTVQNHIFLTPETMYEMYIAIGKIFKLSHLNEIK